MHTQRKNSHHFATRLTLAAAVFFALAGCSQEPNSSASSTTTPAATVKENSGDAELQFARATLERNPNIEVVAIDAQSGVLTVRNKTTNTVSTVKVSEIVAAPPAELNEPNAPSMVQAEPSMIQTSTSTDASLESGEFRVAAVPPLVPATPGSSSTPDVSKYKMERKDGQLKVTGPGLSMVSADPEEKVVNERPASVLGNAAPPSKPYKLSRDEDGQLKVTGRGISVVSTGPGQASAQEDLPVGIRESDPLICEGQRTLQFDSRVIRVEGDGFTVRGGCEVFITNSTIIATGTGVVVRDGVVHIKNSTIRGDLSSFDASNSAKVYLQSATLQGTPRRGERTLVQDQGGNRYR